MLHKIDELEEWKLGYIAGIIDGEGSICLSKARKYNYVQPSVQVAMTDYECVHLLLLTTELGKIYDMPMVEGRKRQYRWMVTDRLEIYLLLKGIRNYLVVKRKQADIMLEFVERRMQDIPNGGHDFELRTEIKKLNH